MGNILRVNSFQDPKICLKIWKTQQCNADWLKTEKISARPTQISAGNIYVSCIGTISRDYTEEEFYACFEKKFEEKFLKVRKCRLPWDRQENFTHCETILESVSQRFTQSESCPYLSNDQILQLFSRKWNITQSTLKQESKSHSWIYNTLV